LTQSTSINPQELLAQKEATTQQINKLQKELKASSGQNELIGTEDEEKIEKLQAQHEEEHHTESC